MTGVGFLLIKIIKIATGS